jgi:SAM-dependent methyltransferase
MSTEEPLFDRRYWEDRYATPGYAWSGRPNAVLVAEVAELYPDRALDVGSGEGGDALWLAARGWRVTGVDIARSALDKARARAESTDPAAAERIEWQQRDVSVWSPPPASYELVSSQFMHLPDPQRAVLFRALAAAVAPGGTLLVVGHDVSDLESGAHRLHHPELMFGVHNVLAAIEGEGLRVEVAESRARRTAAADGGGTTTVRDVVVRAVRPPSVPRTGGAVRLP